MTFYLRPPSGTTQYHRLEKLAVTRLNFLLRLKSTNGDAIRVHDLFTDLSLVEESDCLIEGTRKDRISHFLLRLAFSCKPELREFIRRAESLLFEVRFQNMEDRCLFELLHSLDNVLFESKNYYVGGDTSVKDSSEVLEMFHTFRKILEQFDSWENLIELYFCGCQTEFIEIPFQFVLDLVKLRTVTLTRGMAYVPVAKLSLVVMAMFDTLLRSGLKKANESYKNILSDNRMRGLFAKLQKIFYEKRASPGEFCVPRHLNHSDVDAEAQFFPPCMSHLHSVLRDRHRLRHHSRIQYTLFLKEAGMPIHEALIFWKREYSLVSGDQKSCFHDWSREENRYTYNIRHLYGLEGSRTNYRGHSCHSLQQSEFGPAEEGGCPFVRFDSTHLANLLKSQNSSAPLKEILESVSKGDYQEACQTFLCSKMDKGKVQREQCEEKIFDRTEVFHRTSCNAQTGDMKKTCSEPDKDEEEKVSRCCGEKSQENGPAAFFEEHRGNYLCEKSKKSIVHNASHRTCNENELQFVKVFKCPCTCTYTAGIEGTKCQTPVGAHDVRTADILQTRISKPLDFYTKMTSTCMR